MLATALAGSPELYPRSSLDDLSRRELLRREAHIVRARPSKVYPAIKLLGGLVGAPLGAGIVYRAFSPTDAFATPIMVGLGIPLAIVGAIFLVAGLIEFREVVIARENIDWDLDEIRQRLTVTPAGTIAFRFE